MATTATSSAATKSVTISSDYYLKVFYKNNTNVSKSTGRSEYSSSELSYEDARALKRAVKQLGSYSYSEDDDLDKIKDTISAFVDTYNNALSSSGKDQSDEVKRSAKQLKKLVDKYKDELDNLGITIDEKKGIMTLNKDRLSASSIDDIKEVFSNDKSDLLKLTKQVSRQLSDSSYYAIYAQMTGAGGHINITL